VYDFDHSDMPAIYPFSAQIPCAFSAEDPGGMSVRSSALHPRDTMAFRRLYLLPSAPGSRLPLPGEPAPLLPGGYAVVAGSVSYFASCKNLEITDRVIRIFITMQGGGKNPSPPFS